jgi:hypothetical protein
MEIDDCAHHVTKLAEDSRKYAAEENALRRGALASTIHDARIALRSLEADKAMQEGRYDAELAKGMSPDLVVVAVWGGPDPRPGLHRDIEALSGAIERADAMLKNPTPNLPAH